MHLLLFYDIVYHIYLYNAIILFSTEKSRLISIRKRNIILKLSQNNLLDSKRWNGPPIPSGNQMLENEASLNK